MGRVPAAFALLAALCALPSCMRKDQIFEFDTSDPYAFDIETSWAVVTDPYAVCRADAGHEFSATGNFRKGDIRRVEGERSVKAGDRREVWYCLEDGWIPSSAVRVYSNKLKALQAVKEMDALR